MDVSLFDFQLPDELVAQRPAPERDASRLLVLPRAAPLEALPGALEHRTFRELPALLEPSDLLVLNETAVFPARLLGRRAATGGKVEVFLLGPRASGNWEALVRSKSRPRPGERIELDNGRDALTFVEPLEEGRGVVGFEPGEDPFAVAQRAGRVPLPPYVEREKPTDEDRARYQTVYARERGSVAAPTAGLHFTPAVLAALEARGVRVAKLVLHVGIGTFLPVRADRVEDHVMHSERYAIDSATLAVLEATRARGGRVVAVGTTSARALESWAQTGLAVGETSIFIYPGYEFRVVNALVTNFHLPKSTLLMLVAAFAGRERILAAYREAIARGYRFYSYGDAMLIR